MYNSEAPYVHDSEEERVSQTDSSVRAKQLKTKSSASPYLPFDWRSGACVGREQPNNISSSQSSGADHWLLDDRPGVETRQSRFCRRGST